MQERLQGADSAGNAGLEDEVDQHWRELFKAGALSTLLGAATEIGSSRSDNDIVRALRRGAGDTLNQTGQQVVRRNLNIQPTLTIRPGFPVRVIVNRDLILEPYRGREIAASNRIDCELWTAMFTNKLRLIAP